MSMKRRDKMKEENIKVPDYKGTWYVIDYITYQGIKYYMLESEQNGDEYPPLVIDEKFNVISDDTYDDLVSILEYEKGEY